LRRREARAGWEEERPEVRTSAMDWRRRRRGEAGPAATRRRGSRAVIAAGEWRRGRPGGAEGIRPPEVVARIEVFRRSLSR
jgi:hypothetical protein